MKYYLFNAWDLKWLNNCLKLAIYFKKPKYKIIREEKNKEKQKVKVLLLGIHNGIRKYVSVRKQPMRYTF